jgi:hypothetical protein
MLPLLLGLSWQTWGWGATVSIRHPYRGKRKGEKEEKREKEGEWFREKRERNRKEEGRKEEKKGGGGGSKGRMKSKKRGDVLNDLYG